MILKDFCQFSVVAREKDQKQICVELEVFNTVSDWENNINGLEKACFLNYLRVKECLLFT